MRASGWCSVRKEACLVSGDESEIEKKKDDWMHLTAQYGPAIVLLMSDKIPVSTLAPEVVR